LEVKQQEEISNLYEKLSEERKQLQKDGELPKFFTTGSWQVFKENYLYDAKGFKDQIKRITKDLAKHAPDFLPKTHKFYSRIANAYGDNWEDVFFNILWKGHGVLSSPVLANGGTDRGSPVSCSGGFVEDSVTGFYAARHEAAVLTKEGFGTSAYLGDIRPRGAMTSKGFAASGSWPVFEGFTQDARDVSQGATRRGAWAGYIEIDHGDFDEWCDNLHKNPKGKNIGWVITRKFIEELESGCEEANRRFMKALWVKVQTGKGYFWKVDHVNEQQPEMYKLRGLVNKASNLCTEIVLHADKDHSYSCILSSQNLVHFDTTKDTGLVFAMMVMLDCITSAFIERGSKIPELDKVVRSTIKGRAVGLGALGFHSYFQQSMIAMEDFEAHQLNTDIFKHMHDESLEASEWLAKELGEPEWCEGSGQRFTHRCVVGETKLLTKKGSVPIKSVVGKLTDVWNGFEWSEVTPFLAGEDEEIYRVHLSNGRYLDCTGDHKWKVGIPERSNMIEGGYKSLTVETNQLRVGDCLPKTLGCVVEDHMAPHLENAYTSGVFCGDGSINNAVKGKYPRNEIRLYGVKVKLESRLAWKSKKPWDLRVDDKLCGIRGYLVDDLLPKYKVPMGYDIESKLEWLAGLIDTDGAARKKKGIDISTANESMCDGIMELLTTLGCQGHKLKRDRVGEIGLSDKPCWSISITLLECKTLFKLGMRLSRVKLDVSTTINNSLNKLTGKQFIRVLRVEKLKDRQATFCLTEPKRGTCIFNGVYTAQCAIAPNFSSATIAGQVSQGIEPWVANTFLQPSAAGELQRINPEFLKLAEERGKYTKELITELNNKEGSVQHLDWLTDHEKNVFKTAFEIDQKALLRLASQRQRYICQGQSLNLFFSADEEEEYIAEVHKEAFLDDRIKGLYYLRTLAGVNASKDGCQACEA